MRTTGKAPSPLQAALRFGLVALGLALAFWATPVRAAPELRTAYLIDAAGTWGVDDAAASSGWKPFSRAVMLGYRSEPVWVRIEWRFDGYGSDVLRLGATYLDEVTLFRPRQTGGYAPSVTGDRHPYTEHERLGRGFNFSIEPLRAQSGDPANRSEPLVLYARIRSTSTMALTVEGFDAETFDSMRLNEQALAGGYFGVMTILLLWALLHALLFRESEFMWFVGYQTSSLLMAAGLLGYASMIFFPASGWADDFTSLTVLASTVVGTQFHRTFLSRFDLPASVQWVLAGALMAGLINLALFGAGFTQLALKGNVVVAVLGLGLALPLVALASYRLADKAGRAVLLGYIAYGAVLLLTLLPMLGAIEPTVHAPYLSTTHGLIGSLILGGLLLLRRKRLVEAEARSRELAVKAQGESSILRDQRDERDRFLAMLAHELKTPLSVIRLVLEDQARDHSDPARQRMALHAQSAVQDINSVIDLTVQVDRLETGRLAMRPVPCDVREILSLAQRSLVEAGRIRIEPPPVPLQVWADPVVLKIVFVNLLDNATKYSPRESSVDVLVLELDIDGRHWAQISVKNKIGPAGAPDPDRVFEKFWRSPQAQGRSGSGLGLYLVTGLCGLLGGKITCHTDHDASTVSFICRLPLVDNSR